MSIYAGCDVVTDKNKNQAGSTRKIFNLIKCKINLKEDISMMHQVSPLILFFLGFIQIAEDTGMIFLLLMFVIFLTGHHIAIT